MTSRYYLTTSSARKIITRTCPNLTSLTMLPSLACRHVHGAFCGSRLKRPEEHHKCQTPNILHHTPGAFSHHATIKFHMFIAAGIDISSIVVTFHPSLENSVVHIHTLLKRLREMQFVRNACIQETSRAMLSLTIPLPLCIILSTCDGYE